MIALLLVILALAIIISYFYYGKMLTPINFVVYIWLTLCSILVLEFTYLPNIPLLSLLTISLSLVGVLTGCFVYNYTSNKCQNNLYELSKTIKKLRLLLFFSLPIILYGMFFFLRKVTSVGVEGYLMETKWVGEQIGVFYNKLGYSFATVVVKGFIYATFFFSLSYFYVNGKKKYIIISTLMLMVFSLILFSRIEMLVIFTSFCVAYCLTSKITYSFYFKLILFCICAFSILLIFTYVRGGGEKSIVEMINQYVFYYHLYGLSIFSMVVDGSLVLDGVDSGYGLLTFPIVSFFFEQGWPFIFNERFYSPATEARGLMQYLIDIPLSNGEVIKTNAFYTSLFLFYKDFGLVGVFFIPLVYGYFFTKSYNDWFSSSSPIDLSFVLFWFYTGYTALFFPPQIAEFYWFCFLSLLFLKYSIKKY